MREGGGNCLKYLKMGWNRKGVKGNKDFKKRGGGKLRQGLGALKREGGGLESRYKLRSYEITLASLSVLPSVRH